MDSQTTPNAGSWNEFQARRLRVTCQYMDKLLGEVEEILNVAASKAAFPRYSGDIAPAQRRTIEDYISRIRAQLVRVLDGQGIPREEASIPASRAIHVLLGAIGIAAEELKPQYMRGYGDLPEAAATELNGIVGELDGLVTRLDRYLVEGAGRDLKVRLQLLEQASHDLRLLSRIEQVVAERGLVEFRATIASILDRAEDKTFEIAVFGRVSSGKSSLLNAILETAVLPVGVTPITAVLTRIAFGETPVVTVSFAEAPTKTAEVSRLADFATEQGNPGNAKRVARIVVQLPAARLRDGVTFVDTPGLGSLATKGAAETLAYLPKCDLGVVLIDAGSTLTAEDLQTILRLQGAAIPVNVLLSKADLLNERDCETITQYVKEHIALECSLELAVHPVSVLPSHQNLLNRWFEEQILPLYDRSQELKAASLRRKIGALRESVVSALRIRMERSHTLPPLATEQIRATEARLRRATGIIEETRSRCEREAEHLEADASEVFREAAVRLADTWSEKNAPPTALEPVIHSTVLECARGLVRKFQDSLERLSVQLERDLRQSAEELGISDVPGNGEFRSLIRGMPVFEPGEIHVSVSRPTLSAWFGRRFVEERLAKRIHDQLGEPFDREFSNYLGVLKDWTRRVAAELDRRFETYAERYRAHAERALDVQVPTDHELRAIEANLQMLDRPGAEMAATHSADGDMHKKASAETRQ